MPRPAYIVCCERMVEDKTTGLVSLFTLHEKIIAQKGDTQTVVPVQSDGTTKSVVQLPPFFECTVLAVWMSEPGDSNSEAVHEFTFTAPTGHVERPGKTPFRFAEPGRLQRFRLNLRTILPTDRSGFFSFESTVRIGDGPPISQSCLLELEVINDDKPETAEQ